MTETAVILPIFNEEQSLESILQQLQAAYDFDILVVDDASTDSSAEIARQIPQVTVLPLRTNLGAWGAIQTGIRYANRSGYSQVITMDGDGQHLVEEIAKLLQAADHNSSADVIIGACTERGSRLRKFAWRYFRRITGVGIEDITSGFRLYKKQAMDLLSRTRSTLLDYQDVGVLLLLQEARLRVMEIKVKMKPRISGKSHIYYSWFAVAYYMFFTTILSIAKGKPFSIRKAS